MMDKRYQVFVSSTFEDLREERAAVIEALLRLDCIPSGMELFPAADDDSWTLIKSVIDDCDYYVVIVGGRYGSLHATTGKSYTQMEYEYAVETGKPTIAFLHSNPGAILTVKTQQNDDARKLLQDFRVVLQVKNCPQWADRGELVAAVLMGILHLKKTRPAVGWVKATDTSDEVRDELLHLHRQIDELTNQLADANSRAVPSGTEVFVQGSEETSISFDTENGVVPGNVSWQEIIRAVLPYTHGDGAIEKTISSAVEGLVRRNYDRDYSSMWVDSKMWSSDFSKIMNQMQALGLVEARSSSWVATPYGRQTGPRMVAIKKGEEKLPFKNGEDDLPF